jgi:hypothetical protein
MRVDPENSKCISGWAEVRAQSADAYESVSKRLSDDCHLCIWVNFSEKDIVVYNVAKLYYFSLVMRLLCHWHQIKYSRHETDYRILENVLLVLNSYLFTC